MMQNLPFLGTQNILSQNVPSKITSQKPSESGISFKDLLSKQSANDTPKAPENMQSPNQTQEQTETKQSEKASNNMDGNHTVDETKSSTSKTSSSSEKKSADKNDSDKDDSAGKVASQDSTNPSVLAAQMMSMHLAASSTSTQSSKSSDVSVDESLGAQSKLQLDMGLKTGIGTKLKDASSEIEDGRGKNLALSDATAVDEKTQDGPDSKWLDSVLPKMQQQKGSGTSDLSAKIGVGNLSAEKLRAEKLSAEKLSAEMGKQFLPELSEKFKKETVTAIVPNAALQTVARLDDAQIQAASGNVIQPSPGKAGWDQAISQKVIWMVGAEEQSATLTLNPPDLGPLQVVISVNNDKADTTFISENPEVRKVLESGISTLRGLMDQAGVQLGQANVSSQQQQEYQQAAKERSFQNSTSNSEVKTAEAPVVKRTILRTNNGLVDTFA